MSYHPHSNGTIEAFSNIIEYVLTKMCNVKHDDWDQQVTIVLWSHKETHKGLTKHTPFIFMYGKEVVMLLEFVVPSLKIVA
jgi:hypothetical protein